MTEPNEPAPAVSPSTASPDLPAEMREVSVPMTSFVRGGGTITSDYERQLQAERADAEQRRNVEDQRRKVTTLDPNARISTTKLGGTKSHAAIVLEIRNSDGKAEEFITCELQVDPGDPTGLMLIACCPFCAAKVGMDKAQMTIRSNHRKFELDTRRQGELWVNPNDPNEFVHLAGTIHLTEVTTCPGCSRRFVIDNSVLRWL